MLILKTGTLKKIDNKGFTFIEISVVLILIGMMLLFALPRFNQFLSQGDLDGAARRLSTVIRHVKSESALAKRKYYLNYDIEQSRYFITFETESGDIKEDHSSLGRSIKLPSGVHFKDINTPREGTVTEGVPYTVFFARGLIEMTVIHLESKKGKLLTLIIKPLIGGVRIYDKYLEIERKGIYAF